MKYFSTFLTGFGNLITKELKKQTPVIKIEILLDGLISFSTNMDQNHLKSLGFLNNIYLQVECIKTGKGISSGPNLLEENIWEVQRNEGFLFRGERLTVESKPYLEKGQIQGDLAYLMCLLSEPKSDDIFLDPFTGSGAIPIERLKFPFKKILAGDMDGRISQKLKSKCQKENLPILVGRWDTLHLEKFENKSIDKIVTDPPWGLYWAKHLDLQMFYSKMLKEFFRVLKPNGIVVLLVSNKELLEKLIRELNKFKLIGKYSTLVHGQKAGVYKLKKL